MPVKDDDGIAALPRARAQGFSPYLFATSSVVLHSVCNLFDPPLTKATRAIKEPSFPRRRESNLVGCH